MILNQKFKILYGTIFDSEILKKNSTNNIINAVFKIQKCKIYLKSQLKRTFHSSFVKRFSDSIFHEIIVRYSTYHN